MFNFPPVLMIVFGTRLLPVGGFLKLGDGLQLTGNVSQKVQILPGERDAILGWPALPRVTGIQQSSLTATGRGVLRLLVFRPRLRHCLPNGFSTLG